MYSVPRTLAAGRSGTKRPKTSETAQSSILSSVSFVVGEVKSAEVVVEARRLETAVIKCLWWASRSPQKSNRERKERGNKGSEQKERFYRRE